MEKKTALDLTHELLLEMAKSGGLRLHFQADKPLTQSECTWHSSYMKEVVSAVFKAYRGVEAELNYDAVMKRAQETLDRLPNP